MLIINYVSSYFIFNDQNFKICILVFNINFVNLVSISSNQYQAKDFIDKNNTIIRVLFCPIWDELTRLFMPLIKYLS